MDIAIAHEDERRALAAFSSRDFRLLWGGHAISFTGDAAFTVAPTTILALGGTVAVTLWFAPLAWRRVREAD